MLSYIKHILRGVEMTPSLKATLAMTSALCCHFFGYEMARAASIALLAAKDDIGLGSGALSFTVAVGSPVSASVLYLYARSIKKNGPRLTLLASNMGCVLLLFLMALACGSLRGIWGQSAVLLFYCFREIYVSLLSTQHWSFIASVLDSKSSSYLVSIAGIVSVASAVGGCSVEAVVSLGGVRALLIMAFLSCAGSFFMAEVATFNAPINIRMVVKQKEVNSTNGKDPATTEKKKSAGFMRESFQLLMKHDTLQLLFCEALVHQSCSNMLNMMFHDGLRHNVPSDSERAVLVGRFFASVNIAACLMQIFVMPSVLSQSTLPQVLSAIPVIILIVIIGGYLYPCLLSVMLAFGTLKVLEYSIMTSATEMIYMPMGHEHRYLGKELIRFFGHRMGKSGATLVLSTASGYFNPSMGTQSLWSIVITTGWSGAMIMLSRHLALRNDALAAVAVVDKNPEVAVKTTTTTTTTTTATAPLVDVKPIDHIEVSEVDIKVPETVSVSSSSKLSSLPLPLNGDNGSRDSNATTTSASTAGTADEQHRNRLNSDSDSMDEGAETSPLSPATLWGASTRTGGDGHTIAHETNHRLRDDYGQGMVIQTSSDEHENGGSWTEVDARLDLPPSLGGSPYPSTKDGIRRRKNNESSVPRRPSRTFEDIYDLATVTTVAGGGGIHNKPTLSSRGSDGQLGSSPNTPNKRKNTVEEVSWLSKWAGTLTGMDSGRKNAGRPLLLRVGSTNFSVLDIDPKIEGSQKTPIMKNTSLFRVGSTNMNFANFDRFASGIFDTSGTKEKR